MVKEGTSPQRAPESSARSGLGGAAAARVAGVLLFTGGVELCSSCSGAAAAVLCCGPAAVPGAAHAAVLRCGALPRGAAEVLGAAVQRMGMRDPGPELGDCLYGLLHSGCFVLEKQGYDHRYQLST